jgi:hypothetical protein
LKSPVRFFNRAEDNEPGAKMSPEPEGAFEPAGLVGLILELEERLFDPGLLDQSKLAGGGELSGEFPSYSGGLGRGDMGLGEKRDDGKPGERARLDRRELRPKKG